MLIYEVGQTHRMLLLLCPLQQSLSSGKPRRVRDVPLCQICSFVNSVQKRGVIPVLNKTTVDGGIAVDFWIIKVHTSN